jgi:outer membrane protein assembly factor BamB
VVLVKYNSSGTAQWAKSVSGGTDSNFNAVAVDSSGNIYAAGVQTGTDAYNYGTSVTPVTAQGTSSATNVVLVKYNSLGTAQWAKSVSGGTNSNFNAVAVDSSGNIYATGYQDGTGAYTYGTSVAQGTGSTNVVLVKYNSSGTAQWARTVSSGSSASVFNAVAVDGSGIYAAGVQNGTDAYNYGSAARPVTATGGNSTGNAVLVKYDYTE